LIAAVVLMTVAWLISIPKKDVSIVDAFWGPGFVVVAAVAFWVTEGAEPRRWLLLTLCGIWGLRLGIYLLIRNLGEGEEDYRYQAMRKKIGPTFTWVSRLRVFFFQAVLFWFISFPLQLGISSAEPAALGWLDALGALFWVVGFFFETVGDGQLARFKADPSSKGQVMDKGLWRYTRHPNYFGDFMVWWGFFLIALAVPGGWKTIASPILMSIFLMKISGVGLLEKKLKSTRPGYMAYAERTNTFFPWLPKQNSSTS